MLTAFGSRLGRMVESAFTVTFGGPTSTGRRVPVRDLAPALLALGELMPTPAS